MILWILGLYYGAASAATLAIVSNSSVKSDNKKPHIVNPFTNITLGDAPG